MIFATHNGYFHPDDVFGYFLLKKAFNLNDKDVTLLRTRDENKIKSADIVWDVGLVYNPDLKRFDHHMANPPMRPDFQDVPFSACGLIFWHYGIKILNNYLDENLNRNDKVIDQNTRNEIIKELFNYMFSGWILSIDKNDNGIPGDNNSYDIQAIIADMNPTWDDPRKAYASYQDECFIQASHIAEKAFSSRIDKKISQYMAIELFKEKYLNSETKQIIVLDKDMPYDKAIRELKLDDVMFVVSHDTINSKWKINAILEDPKTFKNRLLLNPAWRGLSDEELQKASGLKTARFVHRHGFIGVADTIEDVLEMGRMSIDLAQNSAIANNLDPH